MELTIIIASLIAFVFIGLFLTLMILFAKAKLIKSELCQIQINHNSDLTIKESGGQTLLSALAKNSIAVPSPCGGKATCKQCKVQIVQGVDPPIEVDKGTFNRKELENGWRLSCQCKLKHDLQIAIPEHLLSVKIWTCKVLSNKNVATFIKELIVEAPEEIPYRSGGYLQVHVPPFRTNTNDWKQTMDEKYFPDWEKYHLFGKELDFTKIEDSFVRAYSMASFPAEGKKLIFNVRIATPPFVGGKSEKIPWGVCSSYMFSLKAGEEVQLSGPYGESFMIDDDRELIFLIGGAGSSFGRSHIMHLFHTENTKRKVTLWYGARSLKENIYQEEYEQLAKEHDNFTYHLVLSEPLPEDFQLGWPKNDPTRTNYLFKAFELGQLSKMDEPEENLYYVCGPPLHNSSVMKLLDNYGVPRENIVLDDFGN